VTEKTDIFEESCKPELDITEELIFEQAVYQDVLNKTQLRFYLNDHKRQIFILCVQTLM
jgi:hypothetical protein